MSQTAIQIKSMTELSTENRFYSNSNVQSYCFIYNKRVL